MKQRFIMFAGCDVALSLLWVDGCVAIESATDTMRSAAERWIRHGVVERIRGVEIVDGKTRWYAGRVTPLAHERSFSRMARKLSRQFSPLLQFLVLEVPE